MNEFMKTEYLVSGNMRGEPQVTMWEPKEYRCPICKGKLVTDGRQYSCPDNTCEFVVTLNTKELNKVNVLQKAWLALDNNKRIIGVTLMGAGELGEQLGLGIVGTGAKLIGSFVAGVGTVHAIKKRKGTGGFLDKLINFLVKILNLLKGGK